MTVKRNCWEIEASDDHQLEAVEKLAMANCALMLLSRVGESGRVYNCKTCNKEFKSFQALGGHRASHRRTTTSNNQLAAANINKPKKTTHECSICGLDFPIGQALGGHMRRHRDINNIISNNDHKLITVEKRGGLCLDLNLTPYENDMKLWSNTISGVR